MLRKYENVTQRIEEVIYKGREQVFVSHGIGDLAMGAKWVIIEACPLGARHALAPSVKFPTADQDQGLGSGETDYDVTWIMSRSIGSKTGVHLNVGYSCIGGVDDDVFHYGVALDYQILDAVQWVGEVFAEEDLSGDSETAALYNAGIRWKLVDGLVLDIAAGSKLSGDVPDFMGKAGLTWAFGFNDENLK